ncbi:MAG: hypothetical protein WEB88_05210 [Gemmatimonadota bacterium]
MSRHFLPAVMAAAALCACEPVTAPDYDDDGDGGGNGPTTGQVAFWTDVAGLVPIDVQVGGTTTRIATAHTAAPACGGSGTATVTLSAGSHAYAGASTTGVTWNGSVDVAAGGCLRFRLTGSVPPGSTDFSAPSTYFADPSGTLGIGSSSTTGFTLTATTTFVLRFVSEYQAQAAIIPANQLDAFRNGQGFTGWALFDRNIGTQTVTLGPGQYYVGVRNVTQASNRYRAELDYDIQLAPENGYTFSYVDSPLQGAETVGANGGMLWHGFTIQEGYRYLLDGASLGLEMYIIPASQLNAFRGGQTFQYYPDYSGSDGAYPGLWELKLPPGSYYLAVHNPGSIGGPITYLMERWRIN